MPFEVRPAVLFFPFVKFLQQVAVAGEVYDVRRHLLQLRGAHVKKYLP